MNRFFCLLAVLSFGVGCPASEPTVVDPVVTVDFEHSQLGAASASERPHYTAREGDGIVIDASTFDFSKAPYSTTAPNSVQLVLGQDQIFSAAMPAGRRVALRRETLTPLKDSSAFRGFFRGQMAVVAIGAAEIDATDKTLKLKVQWAGMIDIQPGGR